MRGGGTKPRGSSLYITIFLLLTLVLLAGCVNFPPSEQVQESEIEDIREWFEGSDTIKIRAERSVNGTHEIHEATLDRSDYKSQGTYIHTVNGNVESMEVIVLSSKVTNNTEVVNVTRTEFLTDGLYRDTTVGSRTTFDQLSEESSPYHRTSAFPYWLLENNITNIEKENRDTIVRNTASSSKDVTKYVGETYSADLGNMTQFRYGGYTDALKEIVNSEVEVTDVKRGEVRTHGEMGTGAITTYNVRFYPDEKLVAEYLNDLYTTSTGREILNISAEDIKEYEVKAEVEIFDGSVSGILNTRELKVTAETDEWSIESEAGSVEAEA